MATRIWNISLALVLVSLMIFSAMAPAFAATRLAGPTDPAELGAFIDDFMAAQMEPNHVAGAAISVVKDGEIFFAKGYGYADVKNRVPVDRGCGAAARLPGRRFRRRSLILAPSVSPLPGRR